MKYQLITNQGKPYISIKAEDADQWTGHTYGSTIEDTSEYGPMLVCGAVRAKNGKEVTLRIKLEGKRDLADLCDKMTKAQAEYADLQKRTVGIYLSSRGWGDFSPVEWRGDITRQEADILTECKALLKNSHDVDQRNQTDDKLLGRIRTAREKWYTEPENKAAREAAEAADIKRKVETGYCFACESWCHGDCGHYSNDPMVKFRRDLVEAQKEANYGIND